MKGINPLIILIAWKHKKNVVFNAAAPDANKVLWAIKEEGKLCCTAGAKELRVLFLGIG